MKVKKQARRTVYDYAKGDFNSLRCDLEVSPIIRDCRQRTQCRYGLGKVERCIPFTAVDSHIPKSTVILSLLTGLPTLRRI